MQQSAGQGHRLTGTPTALALGYYLSCAISSGSVYCWGEGFGDSPAAVSGMSNAVGLGAGLYFECAVLSSGKVACTGRNEYGRLGVGSTSAGGGPAEVTGINGSNAANKAVEVAVGQFHACARMEDGTVKCWGYNDRLPARRRNGDENLA